MAWTWTGFKYDPVFRFKDKDFFQTGQSQAEARFWKMKIHEEGDRRGTKSSIQLHGDEETVTVEDDVIKEEDLVDLGDETYSSSDAELEQDKQDFAFSKSTDSQYSNYADGADCNEIRGDENHDEECEIVTSVVSEQTGAMEDVGKSTDEDVFDVKKVGKDRESEKKLTEEQFSSRFY